MSFNLFEIFKNARSVAWPLGACSILALAIVLERVYTLFRIYQMEKSAFVAIQSWLQKDSPFNPSAPEVKGSPLASIVDVLSKLRGASEEGMWQAADVALTAQRLRLRRYLNALATIGSIAPYIGLLGTVIGVMHSFATMKAGGISSEKITGDISEALSATALGLLVAIPSVAAYNFLLGQVQNLMVQVHSHIAVLMPTLHRAANRSVKQEG